jgi:hypothetical protein
MARFYSNENFPLQTVRELRRLGHDVLTSNEAGNANRAVPDEEVFRFAVSQRRTLLTQNRLHFLRLHQRSGVAHAGIVICTYDPDFNRLASQIHEQVAGRDVLNGLLLRVYRPQQ